MLIHVYSLNILVAHVHVRMSMLLEIFANT